MTHALEQDEEPDEVTASFQPEHAPAGSPSGGEFVPGGGSGTTTKPAAKPHTKPRSQPHRTPRKRHDDGTLAYDPASNHGTGYDSPDGDPRVHKLQQALARLGLTDSAGKPLKDDGKLGPKTTAAVRKAQHRLGLPVDGKVTPALLEKLAAAKSLTPTAKPAAAKKPMHAAAADPGALRDVELARPGDWKVASGDGKFTVQDLIDAADFYAASGGQAVPISLGHVDDRWDGEPTFGNVRNVRYLEDDRGPVLRGDITDMPEWLAASAPKRWPNRSIEGWRNVEYEGRTYSLVLTGLAFLGVTPPAVRNIRSLADLQTALAASAAQRVFASAPPDDPAEPPDDPDELDEESDVEPPDEPASPIPPLLTPALPAGVSHVAAQAAARIHNAPVRGAGMNLAKYREALAGLPDDASEEDVKAALAAAGLAPAPEFAGESTQELDQRVAAAANRGGLITIDPAQLQEFRDAMVRASALTKRLETQDRDTTITDAVKAGKFPPARRTHYERAWDVDPVGTKEVIASLAAGLVPVTASGYDMDGTREDDELDREISRLSQPRSQRTGA